MKKTYFALIFVIICVFLFASCGQSGADEVNGKKVLPVLPSEVSEKQEETSAEIAAWAQIVRATLAEMTKADANYKISNTIVRVEGFSGEFPGKYEVIVDGNKMMSEFGNYLVMEGDRRYEFSFHFDTWYKRLVMGGWVYSATIGEWAMNDNGLSVLEKSLSNSQNVQDLGDGKYSYHQDGMGPDPDTYIFITTDGLLTGMEATRYGGSGLVTYRTSAFTYTYGGQTLTLPTEFISTAQLPTPENFNFVNGILTWDEVEGVRYYMGYIYKDGIRMQGVQIESAEFNFNKFALSYNWASGVYQIKILAVQWATNNTNNIEYTSDLATFELIYQ